MSIYPNLNKTTTFGNMQIVTTFDIHFNLSLDKRYLCLYHDQVGVLCFCQENATRTGIICKHISDYCELAQQGHTLYVQVPTLSEDFELPF